MQKKVKFHGRDYIYQLLKDGKINIDGETYSASVIKETENLFRVNIDNYQFNLERINGKLYLEGEEIDVNIKPYLGDIDTSAGSGQSNKAIVKAPIPGKILQIIANKNQKVSKDQEILVLEAMKMRNRILSPIEGIVMEIYVSEGQNVSQDQELVRIENIK
ncbi:MAG: biotin/lipoyl-containing protein [Promethearchaeota archaeon]